MTESSKDIAALWLERNRPDKAEPELRRALAEDPEDTKLKIDLAWCLVQLDREAEALPLTEEAIGVEPDWTYGYYIQALAYLGLDRDKKAEQVALAALELDPEGDHLYGVLASARLGQKKWKAALEAAEIGLSIDPENKHCLHTRSLALVQTGQTENAAEGLAAALKDDPENPQTHYLLGWNALHRGKHDEAIQGFREALRLDPQSEPAREGLVDALKAKQGFYRPFLAFFLFLGRLPQHKVWMVFLGLIFLRRYLHRAADAYPDYALLFQLAGGGILAFILMSWIAQPLFDLVLRLTPHGRFALGEKEIFRSNCLGGVLLVALILLILGLTWMPSLVLVSLVVGSWSIPMLRALQADGPKTKVLHRSLAILLLILGSVGSAFHVAHKRWLDEYWGTRPEFVSFEWEDQKAIMDEPPGDLRELRLHRALAQTPEVPNRTWYGEVSSICLGFYVVGFVVQTWLP